MDNERRKEWRGGTIVAMIAFNEKEKIVVPTSQHSSSNSCSRSVHEEAVCVAPNGASSFSLLTSLLEKRKRSTTGRVLHTDTEEKTSAGSLRQRWR